MKEYMKTSTQSGMQLTASMVCHQMSNLVCDFSSSGVYHKWNTTVDDLAGEYYSCL